MLDKFAFKSNKGYMKTFNDLYRMLMEAYGDNMRSKYIEQGIDKNIVDSYIGYFNDFRSKKFKELFNTDIIPNVKKEQRLDISAYKNFHDLEQIVDYVRGQRQVKSVSSGKEIIDVKPIFEDDKIIIYLGMSPEECVAIKGNSGASWCVARDRATGNMFNTYRYKDYQPTFYFIKDKNKDKSDKYHFFVLQKTKINDLYILTSFLNDGDKKLNWNGVIGDVPFLKNYKDKFKHISLNEVEKRNYDMYKDGLSDDKFKKLSFDEKKAYIDIYCGISNLLSDNQFNELNFDLKNFYIGLGIPLTHYQFSAMYSDLKLRTRFVDMWNKYFSHPEINYKPWIIGRFDELDRVNFMKLCDKSFTIIMGRYPTVLEYIPNGKRLDVMKLFRDSFAKGLEDYPPVVEYIPEGSLFDVLRMFKSSFEKVFSSYPNVIIYIKEDDKLAVVKMFRDSFAKGFKSDSSAIFHLSKYYDQLYELFPDTYIPNV